MWEVSKYQRSGDDLRVESHPLKVTLRELQIAFGRPTDEPMYASFPITEAQRAFVEDRIGCRLDWENFDYFVECASDEAADT